MRTNRAYQFIILIVAVRIFPGSGCATEPRRSDNLHPGDYSYANGFLDWIVRREMAGSNIPGCAVAVVTKDSIIFQQAYGVADTEKNIPATTQTFFRAGSLTKSLTALAIMKLSEEHKIDIDVPITQYIKEFAIKSRFKDTLPLTARMLLSHKSGMMGDYLYGIMGEHRLSLEELVKSLQSEYLAFPPLEIFLYSNTGYSLLGLLIERVSGMKYEDYIKKEILQPIGMAESALLRTPAIEAQLAGGHMPRSLGFMPTGDTASVQAPFVDIRDSAAGGLLTNIEELGRYVQFFLNDKDGMSPRIVSTKSFLELQKVQFPEVTQKVSVADDYGLGFMRNGIVYDGVDDCVHHSGSVNGFFSFMVFSPKQGLGMILLTNSSSGFFSAYKIVSRSFKMYLEAKSGSRLMSALPKETVPFPVKRDQLLKYTGRYAVLGIAAEVRLQGDDLWLALPSLNLDLLLIPVGENRFKPVAKILLVFNIEVAGFLGLDRAYIYFEPHGAEINSLFFEGAAGEALVRLALLRVKETPIPAGFDRYLGTYLPVKDERNKEAFGLYLPISECRLEKKDGSLLLTSPNLSRNLGLLIKPVGEHEAVLAGSGETLFFTDDTITIMGLKLMRK